MSRESQTDNGKHAPAGTYTKADASEVGFWRYSMGEWDAPAVQMWTDPDSMTGQDDIIEHNVSGKQGYDPVPAPTRGGGV